ncbi:hypothetical protein Patl1_33405 [Pistacia atlantica]|uniref:Uncharacterized protein n=1 Tax=Pistacia atlantica TaxID=434234 RepID=A0ACC0ZPH9_9ROSI|nr:hypothetical protein Patl1_33405 [Pistacia atlantica]
MGVDIVIFPFFWVRFSGFWCGEPQRETCGTRVFGDGGESSKPLKVTLSGLAKHWTYAMPIGNGGLGAMVWGDVASKTLQLNESPGKLWHWEITALTTLAIVLQSEALD